MSGPEVREVTPSASCGQAYCTVDCLITSSTDVPAITCPLDNQFGYSFLLSPRCALKIDSTAVLIFFDCFIIKNMRVISGKYKGKILKSPTSDNIRPTGDKVKQGLFTKLQFFVQDKIVLDLFCGSGGLGIEALSRGAQKVYFVDKDKRSILLTKQNLNGIDGDYKVINSTYSHALNLIDDKFDLILIDPPYASGVYSDVLNIIYEKKLLNQEGIIVCEHPNELEFDTGCFAIFDQKRYGTVTLTFLSI